MPERADQLEFFARCASGFEDQLAAELTQIRCRRVRPLHGGAAFFGAYEDGLRACLHSRVATRVQLVLGRVSARNADALYDGVRALPWETLVAPGATIAMRATGQNSNLRNTQFTALKVKDAVCDRLAVERGARPDVDGSDPDFSVDILLHRDKATISLNLAGPVLHKRGYREPGVQTEAPLKETLAAGMLLAAGWDSMATDGMGFADPMCGSGTLAIEAALIATRAAPGLLRNRWGFTAYMPHDPAAWERLVAEAEAARVPAWESGVRILAGDMNEEAAAAARANAERAGVAELIEFYVDDAANLGTHLKRGRRLSGGLVACNPPYGHRLLSGEDLSQVYAALDSATAKLGGGWQLAIISPDEEVDTGLGRLPERSIACHNGPLDTSLRIYDLGKAAAKLSIPSLSGSDSVVSVAEGASEQFAARFRKVAKERAKWARKVGVHSYRVYDADLPEYAFSVDVFRSAEDDGLLVRVEEHRAGSNVDAERASRRVFDGLAIVSAVLDVPRERVFCKRARQEKSRPAAEPVWVDVRESDFVFDMDIASQRECGLPLDMRPVREFLRAHAAGKRFACLLAHGGAPSVYAAAGGAVSTVTVDPADPFLEQADHALYVNGFRGREHDLVCDDPLDWARREARAGRTYDLVFCDLSAFPSARSRDLIADHMSVIQQIVRILSPEGKLVLTCHDRRFNLSDKAFGGHGLTAQDITADTIGHDFTRTPKIHRAFLIGHE